MLRNNRVGISSTTSGGGGGGGGCCGVQSIGLCSGYGINISSPQNPITSAATFCVINICPYLGQSVEVLGGGACSTLRCGVSITASACFSAGLSGSDNTITTEYSAISGGCTNVICSKPTITENLSFIGGGCCNLISGSEATILGGGQNNIFFVQNLVCGGQSSTILGGVCGNLVTGVICNSGYSSFIGGGLCNSYLATTSNVSSGCYGVVSGGCNNLSCNCLGAVGGGVSNNTYAAVSNVIGGRNNQITASCSAVGGGCNNRVCAGFSSVIGGASNSVLTTTTSSIIFGGSFNQIGSGCFTFIGGGCNNINQNAFSAVAGGCQNQNICRSVFIGTGQSITIFGNNSNVIGGKIVNIQTASNFVNVINGCTNTLTGDYIISNVINGVIKSSNSSIFVGFENNICCINTSNVSKYNDVVSGNQNIINGEGINNNTIVNGLSNCIQSNNDIELSESCAEFGLILNGCANCILSTPSLNNRFSTILNGQQNSILDSKYSFIGGGICNYTSNANGYVIIGGVGNNTSGGIFDFNTYSWTEAPTQVEPSSYNFIGGGFQNAVNCSSFSAIVGGYCNRVSSQISFIGGGECNVIEIIADDKSEGVGIVGGCNNNANFGIYNSSNSFIGGGENNKTYDQNVVIFGGKNNCVGFICNTQISGSCASVIGGGENNCINDKYGVVLGGLSNIIYCGVNAVLIGGKSNNIGFQNNTTLKTSNYSLIGNSETSCICCGSFSSILSGNTNRITTDNTHILGSGINAVYPNYTYVKNLNIMCQPEDKNGCTPATDYLNLFYDVNTGKITSFGDGITCFGLGAISPDGSGICFCNTPIVGSSASGIICMDLGKGNANQYLTGANSTQPFPNVSSGGGVVYYLNGSILEEVIPTIYAPPIGLVNENFYQLSSDPVIGNTSTDFTLTDNGTISRFVTPANVPNLTVVPNGIWIISAYFSISSDEANITPKIYTYNGGTLTLLSTGNPVKVNTEDPVLYTFTVPFTTTGTYPATTRFAIQFLVTGSDGSKTVTQYTEGAYVSAVSTTFPAGLGSLNSLITPAQTFITSNSGNDFTITSTCCTHCFNLPTASATNRGALSTSDWTNFNSKISTLYQCNSVRVNTCSSAGLSTFQNFCVIPESDIGTTPIFTVTNATIVQPSDINVLKYRYYQFANMVYLCLSGAYAKPGIITPTGGNVTYCVSILMPNDIPRADVTGTGIPKAASQAHIQFNSFYIQGGDGITPSWCGSNLNYCNFITLPANDPFSRAAIIACSDAVGVLEPGKILCICAYGSANNVTRFPDFFSGWVIYQSKIY